MGQNFPVMGGENLIGVGHVKVLLGSGGISKLVFTVCVLKDEEINDFKTAEIKSIIVLS